MLQKTVRQHTANYIEHTDVLIKNMAVQIGKDKTIRIKRDVLNEIFLSIKQYDYETGGIIGINESGIISAFQFDETYSSNPFEYCPNVDFLNQAINEEWANENIEFIGFVHSHLNNCEISKQDIKYARQILANNKCFDAILLGIVDLSKKLNFIRWYNIAN